MQLAEILDASDLIKFIFVSTHQALNDGSMQKTLQQLIDILDNPTIMDKKVAIVFTKVDKSIKLATIQKELIAFKRKQSKEVSQLVGYMEKSIHLVPIGEFNQPKLFETIFKSLVYLNTAEE
jgi:predicted DNA binding CopG/RHH family protein